MVGDQGASYHPTGRHGGSTSMLKEPQGGVATPGSVVAGGDGHIKTEGMKEEGGAMKEEGGEGGEVKDDPEGGPGGQLLQNGQLDRDIPTGTLIIILLSLIASERSLKLEYDVKT